ncbi:MULTISPECIES: hypothetical protein [Cupriavidus]|uniref:hypothetical protein n=1 Tax=Cupriavidus sp. DF5525 TaxID=3160989 RepID=UPI0003B0453F|nr:hypothetical protein N234_34375 [Ralstonia pickettii DTP0602]
MKAGIFAAALAVCSGSAMAASYAWFDRPDEASANSHAAVSNDIYVRGWGWAWGELLMRPDAPTTAPAPQDGRQARDILDRRDAVPWRQHDENEPPRHPRGKISMNLAAADADGGAGAGRPHKTVR